MGQFTWIILLFLVSVLQAGIVNTKHNLSTSGSGTVKATSEQEVCVFCHIPHDARPQGLPLWNRTMHDTGYMMYTSDYLKRASYPTPAGLGTTNNTPGALSRQCLSCHDGTVAVGSVYMVRGTILGSTLIDMAGLTGGVMTSANTGYIGTDLTMHHPVGVEYKPSVSITLFGSGTRTIELKTTPDTPLKLYDYGGTQYVECSSCHDPHTETSKFLRVSSGANHAQNVVSTCTGCHDKTNWTGSVHQSVTTATYTDATVMTKYGSNVVADLGCINCHTPHNGAGKPYLLRQVQANTCFQGAASDVSMAACHGVGANARGGKDIESVLSRSFAHPVIDNSDPAAEPLHSNLDVIYGGGKTDLNGGRTINWDPDKHAVCMDCHNMHQAQAGTHVPAGQWYPNVGTNLVSNVLKGVTGVEPTWPTAWTQPKSFTVRESAEKEYQICMKCHSYWGMGSATKGINDSGYISPSDLTNPMTDMAWELNPNNKSGHPVVVSLNNRVGSYAPKGLIAAQLIAPWNADPGNNVMYCSDCHGSDNELLGDPRGPHGSNLKYVLKGVNQYWPLKPDGTTLYTMDDIGVSDDGVMCKNCHDIGFPHTEWRTAMSGRGFTCVTCHVVVPHGSPTSRLLGYEGWPAPYDYNGSSLKMQQFIKNDGWSFTNTDVYAPSCGAGGMCHNNPVPGADVNLMLP